MIYNMICNGLKRVKDHVGGHAKNSLIVCISFPFFLVYIYKQTLEVINEVNLAFIEE